MMRTLMEVKNYLIVIVFAVLVLWFLKIGDISFPLMVKNTTISTEMSVVGEGKIEVVPDTMYIDTGIVVNNVVTAQEAQNQLTTVNNKIIEAMKKLGIDPKDIKTSNFSVNPNYDYRDGENRIKGYSGNATITIKANDPKKASEIIAAASDAGANQTQGTRFVVDKPEKYREDARNKAIENAKEQAAKLASQLGIRLGKIVNIVESNGSMPYPVRMDKMTMNSAAGVAEAPTLEPGSQTITSTVTLYFERK